MDVPFAYSPDQSLFYSLQDVNQVLKKGGIVNCTNFYVRTFMYELLCYLNSKEGLREFPTWNIKPPFILRVQRTAR